jgi:hypothetical protein
MLAGWIVEKLEIKESSHKTLAFAGAGALAGVGESWCRKLEKESRQKERYGKGLGWLRTGDQTRPAETGSTGLRRVTASELQHRPLLPANRRTLANFLDQHISSREYSRHWQGVT